jgi:hypothetical protein
MSLVLLEPREIRVRSRPWTLAGVWAIRAVFAWVVAAPIVDVLCGAGIDRFPKGDALLFRPGGGYLLETLSVSLGPLMAELRHGVWMAVLLGYLSLVPLAGLMVALAHRGRLSPNEFFARGLRLLPHFTYLGGLTLLAQAAVAFAGLLLAMFLRTVLPATLSVRGTDLCLLGSLALVLLLLLLLGVIEDLARAACVRFEDRARVALKDAFRTLVHRPHAVLLGFGVPAVWSVAVVFLTMLVVSRIPVEGGGTLSLIAVFVVHQAVIGALVLLRSSWLARALALIAPAHPASVLGD